MTEQTKRSLTLLLPILICFILLTALSVFWFRQNQLSAFENISSFCEVLVDTYPETESAVLSSLKEYVNLPKGKSETPFLSQYGYHRELFSARPAHTFFFLGLSCFFLITGGFLSFFWLWEHRKKQRIRELTDYLEQINLGAGTFLLQTKEDEFSHLQDELYKTVTQLRETREHALRTKAAFADHLANIAHQLKTPITAASLSLQLMKQKQPELSIDSVKKQLDRLDRLEEALLTLSKIDSGTLPLEHTKIDLYTALTLAADHLDQFLQKEQLTLSIPDNGPVTIIGDLEWTMEALFNLMKNAMEHSSRGGRIHCDYSVNPIYAEILIWDEGTGFYPEDLPHLFERFYRGKNAAPGGMGIGLWLARSIFELQNGTVTARNLPEGGACFEIRIYSH